MGFNTTQKSTWIVVGVALLFIIILLMQFWEDPNARYLANLKAEREERNNFFKKSAQSPLVDSAKAVFTALSYYGPDPAYSQIADFTPAEGYELIELSRFGGKPDTYIRAGYLNFKIKGEKYQLTAFRQKEGSTHDLFVPFKDLTAGKTTYGGGRYLDLRLVLKSVQLDFNRAYNPFCVFNKNFVCPIPPEENHLKIELPVGEKDYKM